MPRIYDKEGNGYITTDVLREIISEIDPTLTPEVTEPPYSTDY